MQITYYLVAVISAVSVYAQTPDPAINTPSSVQQCLPIQLTFSGSSPPFIITAVPGGQTGATPLDNIGTTSADAITWTPQLPVGTSVTLVIRDSLGRTNPSGIFTILAGNTACVGATSAAGSSSAAANSTAAGSSTVAAVTTPITTAEGTTAAAATTEAAVTTSKASTAATSTSTTSKNGASSAHPMSWAGLMGLVGAAALF